MNHINLVLLLFILSTTIVFNDVEGLEAEALKAEGIIGGEEAYLGQFPYAVSIQVDENHLCGGAIIDDRFVLTAAHCVIDDEGQFENLRFTVVAGINDLRDPKAVRVRVESVYVPREYDPVNPEPDEPYNDTGDVAVLKLRNKLDLGTKSGLSKLKLPVNSTSLYVADRAVVLGFGFNWMRLAQDKRTTQIKELGGGSTRQLRYGNVTVISNDKCRKKLLDPISSSHLCAQMIQRDQRMPEGVCAGDSGSPLVIDDNTVIGVVSSNPIGCKEDKAAAVYTRITSFVEFIENAINDSVTEDMRMATYIKKS